MFQTQVNQFLAKGVEGEYADDSPHREQPYVLLASTTGESDEATVNQLPRFARAFTIGEADGTAVVGGEGVFAGILVNPKMYANYMGLNPTLELPNGSQGGLCTFGHIFVQPATDYAIGDVAAYDKTTGAISAYSAAADIPTTSVQIPHAMFIKYAGTANTPAVLQLGD